MSDKSWFDTGFAGSDREQERRDLGGQPKRWWMAAGAAKEGVFVDDDPFNFMEHQWKVGDSKFPEFGTCTAKIHSDPCPGCSSKGVQKAEYVGHLTSVDISGYTNKEGKEVKYELIEFCPKLKVINLIKLKKEKQGALVGSLFSILRATKESPNTGDSLDRVREVKMEELFKLVTYKGKNISELIQKANLPGEEASKIRKYLAHHFQIPTEGEIPLKIPVFNYAKLHAPMEIAEFKRAVANAVGYDNAGSSTGTRRSGGAAESDDVPF